MSIFSRHARAVPAEPLNQWYTQNPGRYKEEVETFLDRMKNCNPQLVQVKDGRRGFTVDLLVPDCDGRVCDFSRVKKMKYRVLLLWNANHPRSADRLWGGSVKAYMISPSIEEMKQAYTRHGRPYVPHLLRDTNPNTGRATNALCTADPSIIQSERFTILQACGQTINWLVQYAAGKSSKKAYDIFCKEA